MWPRENAGIPSKQIYEAWSRNRALSENENITNKYNEKRNIIYWACGGRGGR